MTDVKDDGCWSVSEDDGGSDEKNGNSGRWTKEEHDTFVLGLGLYGRDWKKVATAIKTRTPSQIRSHAQKYFQKLTRSPIVNDAQPSLLGEDDQDAFSVLEYLETTLKSLKRRRDELDCAAPKSPAPTLSKPELNYKHSDNENLDCDRLIGVSSRTADTFKNDNQNNSESNTKCVSNAPIKPNNIYHIEQKPTQLTQERNGNLRLSRLHEEELIAVQVLCGTRHTNSMESFEDSDNRSGHTSNFDDSDNRSGHSSNNDSEEEGTNNNETRHRNSKERETESETTGSGSSSE